MNTFNTQNEDSQSHSQQTSDIGMENIKCENNTDGALDSDFKDSDYQKVNFDNIGNQNNIQEKRAISFKRSKSYIFEKSKRLTSYLDISQRLETNKQFLNNYNFSEKNSAEHTFNNANFICNLTSGIITNCGGINKSKKNSIQIQPFLINEQQKDAENKLLGLANIALEREII